MIYPDSPAFPTDNPAGTGAPGLSIRAEFAKAAMQGLASSAYWSENFDSAKPQHLAGMAEAAVKAADALLAELNKEAK